MLRVLYYKHDFDDFKGENLTYLSGTINPIKQLIGDFSLFNPNDVIPNMGLEIPKKSASDAKVKKKLVEKFGFKNILTSGSANYYQFNLDRLVKKYAVITLDKVLRSFYWFNFSHWRSSLSK